MISYLFNVYIECTIYRILEVYKTKSFFYAKVFNLFADLVNFFLLCGCFIIGFVMFKYFWELLPTLALFILELFIK
jgi:hypothetical protein